MKISIVIPFYQMPNWEFFLTRCIKSVDEQIFKDYEIILVNKGKWSENHNAGIRQTKGDVIKFLHMDDYFYDENSLGQIAKNFKGGWMATACIHDNGRRFNPHFPAWNDEIYLGKNTIGSPSVLTIENKRPLLFDENLTWLVDCDYYERLWNRYGAPTLLNEINIVIGIHEGQATNLIPNEVKLKEHQQLYEKYSGAKTDNRPKN